MLKVKKDKAKVINWYFDIKNPKVITQEDYMLS